MPLTKNDPSLYSRPSTGSGVRANAAAGASLVNSLTPLFRAVWRAFRFTSAASLTSMAPTRRCDSSHAPLDFWRARSSAPSLASLSPVAFSSGISVAACNSLTSVSVSVAWDSRSVTRWRASSSELASVAALVCALSNLASLSARPPAAASASANSPVILAISSLGSVTASASARSSLIHCPACFTSAFTPLRSLVSIFATASNTSKAWAESVRSPFTSALPSPHPSSNSITSSGLVVTGSASSSFFWRSLAWMNAIGSRPSDANSPSSHAWGLNRVPLSFLTTTVCFPLAGILRWMVAPSESSTKISAFSASCRTASGGTLPIAAAAMASSTPVLPWAFSPTNRLMSPASMSMDSMPRKSLIFSFAILVTVLLLWLHSACVYLHASTHEVVGPLSRYCLNGRRGQVKVSLCGRFV